MDAGRAFEWLTDYLPTDDRILATANGPRQVAQESADRFRLVTPERVGWVSVEVAGIVERFPPDRWEFSGEVCSGRPPRTAAQVHVGYRVEATGPNSCRLSVRFRFVPHRWTVGVYLRLRGAALQERIYDRIAVAIAADLVPGRH